MLVFVAVSAHGLGTAVCRCDSGGARNHPREPVVRFKVYLDREEALEAAGLSE